MQAQSETMTADTTEPATFLETHFGNEQPIVTVPYSTLRPSPLNARTKPLSGIPGLAANIRAKGLLQNLVVHEIKGSRQAAQIWRLRRSAPRGGPRPPVRTERHCRRLSGPRADRQ